MSKYGNKFTCWSCATKFYDLGKANAKCPKCGADPAADPNAGGSSPAPDADFAEVDDEVEAPAFADDEDADDDVDAEEAEPEEEEEGF